MSSGESVAEVLSKAGTCEKKYKWLEAADFYEQAQSVVGKDDLREMGVILERTGYCFFRAAFQVDTPNEFIQHMKRSSQIYEEAARSFEKLEDLRASARKDSCKAKALYTRSWLADAWSARKALLAQVLNLQEGALRSSEAAGDRRGHGRICSDLLSCLYELSLIEWDSQRLIEIVEEAVTYGETAIDSLSAIQDKKELAETYSITSLHCYYGANISKPQEKRKEFSQKCLSYAKKALEFSEKIGDSYLIGLSNWAASRSFRFSGDMSSALGQAEEMLRNGTIARDNYLMGVAGYQLASTIVWKMEVEEDPDKKREGYREAIRYAEEAMSCLGIIGNDYFAALIPLAGSYLELAEAVTSLEDKRIFRERAVEAGRKGLEHAQRSGSPDAVGTNLHELSKALYSLSGVETKASEKKEFLEEASKHRQDYIDVVERLYPTNYWVRGVGQNYQALIKAEMARIEREKERKKGLLKEAVSNMKNGLELTEMWAKSHPQARIFAVLGAYHDLFGGILNQLYLLTEDDTIFGEAIEAYEKSADAYTRAQLLSRSAEAHWNIAKLYDRVSEYSKASRNFDSAAHACEASAEKIHRLKGFYSNYANYMQAWSEIEKAKLAHEREDYASSEKHYRKAATYLQSSRLWDYLTPNYVAWAILERSEQLSRQEQNQKAKQGFAKAAETFGEAKNSLENALSKIRDTHEKEKASELSKACDRRREYCVGRVSIEKARIFESEGDYESSAKNYGLAAKAFEKVLGRIEIQTDRRELQSTIYLCLAWQKMKLAEERVDSALYAEASTLFMKAKRSSLKKRLRLLAAGNSHFCKALGHGVTFKDTRNPKLYSKTKHYMESASDCYTEAGFKKESFWVDATQVLFDSYVYLDKAETEVDPEKKLRLYILAEKFLERSANLYQKAGYQSKKTEVLRGIEKVKRKREFMLSLREILASPSIISSTDSLPAPAPTHEEAVGLERFEQAYVQASLTIRPDKVNVGDDVELEMRLVNTGKQPAALTQVEGIVPKTFELVAKPDYCHFEDGRLDMKGKRLLPLETEDIRLVLRSLAKGTSTIKPRVIYLDKTGQQTFGEPQAVTVNVSQLILPNRTTTGCADLDNLLYGGIPETYAVILTAPSCDEREILIRRFVKVGAEKGQITFYLTTDPSGNAAFAKEYQSTFYLFVCNPRADTMVKSLPNVYRLKGVENLTEISISLTSAFRKLDKSVRRPRRACIDIVSDVLLQHHAAHCRRWLNTIIPELKANGFTILVIMDPQMHPPQEVRAILDLFEGEVNIYEKKTGKDSEKFLRIKKLYNQRYLERELPLEKKRLQQ